jgi:hypothetical protein
MSAANQGPSASSRKRVNTEIQDNLDENIEF